MFRIAIIGRPNVGKSTLFNKLVGKKFAITDDISGVTRDRKESIAQIGPIKFIAIDTAGMEIFAKTDSLAKRTTKQSELAIEMADLCLFMVDGKAGIQAEDRSLASLLRKNHRNYLLVVNKFEGKNEAILDKEFYQLGLGEPLAISAEHKEGFNTLYERIEPFFDKYQENHQKNFSQFTIEEELENQEDKTNKPFLQIAIVGRPNAGKSTLLNKIIGSEKLVTGPEAGITRDAIAIEHIINGQKIRFIDTAGIRKKAVAVDKLEKISLKDSFRAIELAQVVILLIDANLAMDRQDMAIAGQILKEGRAIIFAINKIDQIKGDKELFLKEIRTQIQELFPEISGSPIIGISAHNGYNIEKMLNYALETYQQWQSYINTTRLYNWLEQVREAHTPKLYKGKQTKIKYITQIKHRPPTFAVFTNHIEAVEGDYQRYLLNSLRKDFHLNLTPIRMVVKKSENPYKNKKVKTFSKKLKI